MKSRTRGVFHGFLNLWFALFLGLTLPPSLNAQERTKESLPPAAPADRETLEMLSGYLSQAAQNNPELQSAFYRWKAALERIPQVTALPDPEFTFEYFIRSSAGSRPDKYALMQKFPWFGTLDLKGEMATQEAYAMKAEYDALRLKIFFAVKEAFFELAYLSQAIRISKEEIELLKYMEGIARARYTSGAAPYSDVIRTQVQLGKLENELRTLEDMRKPLTARLASALDLPRETPFPMPPAVPVMVISLEDEEIFRQLPEFNPEIKKFEYLEARERAGMDLARKQYFPEFSLGLEYENAVEDARMEGTPGSNVTEPIRAVFSVSIPFWWERRQAGVREAEANRTAAEKGNRTTQQKLVSDLQMALYKYRDSLRKIDLYQNTLLPKAQEALKVTMEGFQTGMQSSLDLIEAQKVLLEFELSYLRALADQAQRFAELEMLLGKEIPCQVHGAPWLGHGAPKGQSPQEMK